MPETLAPKLGRACFQEAISLSATTLGEVIRLFLRLGFTAFGGPAAHIALMHDEVVTRRGWMSEQHFLDLVGATNLIPGPNSTEMAIHIGYERAGWRGLLAAGLCFIMPAVLIVLALAWLYVEYGSTPQGDALMYGIKPVIIAIVVQALYKLVPTALKGGLLAAVGVGALAAYLLGVNELIVLFGGALLVVALQAAQGFPQSVAALFQEAIQSSLIKMAVFCILDDHNAFRQHNPRGNFEPFKEVFGEFHMPP